ncbi:hypothetical protein [uncultured Sphingomonas sp.]|uniref:hypothetical protein n=1 Tax=uncultured Sphingomonas sp. TaxID=158754 RepID=UPI0025DE9131|nr:hypothetical protein [uncultured Sphingomonas sp.]
MPDGSTRVTPARLWSGFGEIAKLLLLPALLLAGLLLLDRCSDKPDPLPGQTARHDEKAAAASAQAIGAGVVARNADATIHVDLTTKEVHDAFQSLPPAAPTAEPRALPAAPVDRLRDRINEGVARANGAAGPADPAG